MKLKQYPAYLGFNIIGFLVVGDKATINSDWSKIKMLNLRKDIFLSSHVLCYFIIQYQHFSVIYLFFFQTRQLNYSEVQFNKSTSELKVVIGEDRRTPYADIDLTLKADPLPESDSSDDETGANDNDFMTLEEMQALGKSRGNAHEDDY